MLHQNLLIKILQRTGELIRCFYLQKASTENSPYTPESTKRKITKLVEHKNSAQESYTSPLPILQ